MVLVVSRPRIVGWKDTVIYDYIIGKLKAEGSIYYREVAVALGVAPITASILLKAVCEQAGGSYESGWCVAERREKVSLMVDSELYRCLAVHASNLGVTVEELVERLILRELSQSTNDQVRGCCGEYVERRMAKEPGSFFARAVAYLRGHELELFKSIVSMVCDEGRLPSFSDVREAAKRIGVEGRGYEYLLRRLVELGVIKKTPVIRNTRNTWAYVPSAPCEMAKRALEVAEG